MRKILIPIVILAALMIAPVSQARRITYLPATTVNLTVVDTPWTEILRFKTAPAAWGGRNLAEVIMLRVVTGSVAGGTVLKLRVTPAWALADSSIDGEPMVLQLAHLGVDSTSLDLSVGSIERIYAVRWGSSTVAAHPNSYHVLPPYLAVELEENHTGGTIAVEVYFIGD